MTDTGPPPPALSRPEAGEDPDEQRRAQIRAGLEAAVSLHRSGDLDGAEAAYRKVLELDPAEPNCLTNIGTIFFQRGRVEQGVPFLEASLKVKANQPNALSNLANGLTTLGRFAEAREACEQAIMLQPDNAEAFNNLGNCLRELGEPDGAIMAYERAFALNPRLASALGNESTLLRALKRPQEALPVLERCLSANPAYVDAWNEKGNCLQELGRGEEALDAYDRALALQPLHAQAWANKAIAYTGLERWDEAIDAADRAIAIHPAYPEAHNNRGVALRGLKRFEEAQAAFRAAIAIKPDLADSHNNLGITLYELGRAEEAMAAYDKAHALDPNLAEVHANRANILREWGRLDEAMAEYETAISAGAAVRDAKNNRAITLIEMRRMDEAIAAFDDVLATAPDYRDAAFNKSLTYLLKGDYEKGWPVYESRWKRAEFKTKPNPFGKPPWLGQRDIRGKRLLVVAEQGLGDTLQMLRYVPLLVERGAIVIAAVQTALVDLARNVPGIETVLGENQTIPRWDEFIPTMSLPLAMGTLYDTVPNAVPYLWATEEAKAKWAARLGPRTRPRIGLAWSGNKNAPSLFHRLRPIALQTLAPILEFGAEFVSLQIEYPDADRERMQAEGRILDLSGEIKSFMDTAALMDQMDLIVTVDTSVANLAGAMGRPFWVMLPYTSDLRWGLDTPASPWYPTAQPFRQGSERRWEPVIERVRAALAQWMKAHG